ncbi:BNR repeat domain protein [Archangium gephyra]|uniref:BNR repeat domain protein n=1 Tax=Archangium gephyra TaxID=48 RepID=A0AAC8THJ3_9BACT|nr:BNR repeat domain protein [Archangium gephyra]
MQGLLAGDPAPWRARIHATARDNVWAMDSQRLWAWEGQAWRIALEGQGELFAVWTHGAKDTWVAGAEKLLHWDGESWQEHPTPGFTASALWGAWRRDLWAVGRKGSTAALFHWDGGEWREVSSDALVGIGSLEAVAGRCASEVYVAGSGGALLHWDGATWSRMTLPTTMNLYGVATVGKELWVSGGQGAILRQPRPAR